MLFCSHGAAPLELELLPLAALALGLHHTPGPNDPVEPQVTADRGALLLIPHAAAPADGEGSHDAAPADGAGFQDTGLPPGGAQPVAGAGALLFGPFP